MKKQIIVTMLSFVSLLFIGCKKEVETTILIEKGVITSVDISCELSVTDDLLELATPEVTMKCVPGGEQIFVLQENDWSVKDSLSIWKKEAHLKQPITEFHLTTRYLPKETPVAAGRSLKLGHVLNVRLKNNFSDGSTSEASSKGQSSSTTATGETINEYLTLLFNLTDEVHCYISEDSVVCIGSIESGIGLGKK